MTTLIKELYEINSTTLTIANTLTEGDFVIPQSALTGKATPTNADADAARVVAEAAAATAIAEATAAAAAAAASGG